MGLRSNVSRRLPRTAKDVVRLKPREWLVYNGLIQLCRLTGWWRYPVPASGDLETMTFLDKVYWVYKAVHPIRHPARGSGLDQHFERQKRHNWRLPDGFDANTEISISAAGDLMTHEYLATSGDALYADIADLLFDADVSMANLECTINSQGTERIAINTNSGPPLSLDEVMFQRVKGHRGRKFTFLATACNHSLDFGPDGVDSTIRLLRSEGIAFNGVNASEEDASTATIVDAKGVRIGLFAFTFGLNAWRPPADRPRIVNRTNLNGRPDEVDLKSIEALLEHCRTAGVDFVIAHLHWGMEHELFPRPEQIETAHALAELGVDAIVGHHPHVAQPVEFYMTRRDPDRVVPIYYSLGNLVNPFTAAHVCMSRVAQLKLAKGTARDGSARTYVKHASYADVVQSTDERAKTIRLSPRMT